MAETTAPAADAMQDIVSSVPTEIAAPEEPDVISETLYIQNLNEKIKIEGDHLLLYRSKIY
jgi:U2 small nuclear ribonucleoprotein B''